MLDTVVTLVDELLSGQQQLTAVEKFAQRHARHSASALAPHYRDLIPLSLPRPGEQYAFEVNLDRCSGCKGCVTACHALNGLDDDESWREIGFLQGELPGKPGQSPIAWQQTVTTACHHCVEPACQLGCPVLAYDKDPVTGIVRHLDDQCIGCSYCILKCPYEVPKYSARRGIVRKCDLCQGRLAEGEAPACVQSCPNEAIQITLVRPADLKRSFRSSRASPALPSTWLPDAPDPALTLPTTRYLSRQNNSTLLAANHFRLRPSPAHLPLVWMLVLTQAGMGMIAAASLLSIASVSKGEWTHPVLATAGFAFFSLGLLASVFHLGQPRKAWRIWLGWRTSWLSREAILLNLLAGTATAVVGLLWAGVSGMAGTLPLRVEAILRFSTPGGILTFLVFAFLSLMAQTLVYADTRRAFWRFSTTASRFFGTALIFAALGGWIISPSFAPLLLLVALISTKLAVELSVLKYADSDSERWNQLRRTAALQWGPLRPLLGARLLLGFAGGLFLPWAVSAQVLPPEWAFVCAVWVGLGEVLERALFFTSVAPDSMPGIP